MGEFFEPWMSVNDDRLKGTNGSSEGETGQVMDWVGITLSAKQMQQLKKPGIGIALVSDCVIEMPVVWPSTPFAPLFETTVFSRELGARKPDAHLYERAMKSLGVTQSDCLFVADGGSNELKGARELGIAAYFLDDQSADLSTVMRVDVHE